MSQDSFWVNFGPGQIRQLQDSPSHWHIPCICRWDSVVAVAACWWVVYLLVLWLLDRNHCTAEWPPTFYTTQGRWQPYTKVVNTWCLGARNNKVLVPHDYDLSPLCIVLSLFHRCFIAQRSTLSFTFPLIYSWFAITTLDFNLPSFTQKLLFQLHFGSNLL